MSNEIEISEAKAAKELAIIKKRELLKKSGQELLDNELPQYYPDCFNQTALKPLKIGIYEDIKAEHPEINKKIIKAALKLHCKVIPYLSILVAGSQRINLKGEVVEAVTEAGAEYGQLNIKRITDKAERAKQRKIDEAAQLKAELENPVEKPVVEKKPVIKVKPAEPKKQTPEPKITQKVKKPIIVTKKSTGVKITTKRPTLAFLKKDK